MKFDLEYFEDGEMKIKSFDINFISNRMFEKRADILGQATDVKINYDNIHTNIAKMAAKKSLIASAKDKEEKKRLKEEIKALDEENILLGKKIKGVGAGDFFQKRFELLVEIFEKNGIKEEKFLSFEFWSDNVDFTEMMRLVDAMIDKDVNKKKLM